MRHGFKNRLLCGASSLKQKLKASAGKLCLISASFGAACSSVPDHEISSLVVEGGTSKGAWAMRTKTPDKTYWRPIETMDKYLCRSPEDERKLIEWAKRQVSKK